MSMSKSLVLSVILLASVLTNFVLGVPISLETVSDAHPRTTESTKIDTPDIQFRVTDRQRLRKKVFKNIKTVSASRLINARGSIEKMNNPLQTQVVLSAQQTRTKQSQKVNTADKFAVNSGRGQKRIVKCSHSGNSSSKDDAVVFTERTVVPYATDFERDEVEKTPFWLVGVMMGVVVLSEAIKTVVVSFQAYRLSREVTFEDDRGEDGEEEQVDISPSPVDKPVSNHSETPYSRSDSLETIDLNNGSKNDAAPPPTGYYCDSQPEDALGGSLPYCDGPRWCNGRC